MAIVGYAVRQCQMVEYTISYCWLLNAKFRRDSGRAFYEIWDIDEATERNARKTLGGLLSTMNADKWFKKPLRSRLTRFVKMRNRLIHTCFRGKGGFNVRRRNDLIRLHRLASNIIHDGIYFEEVFDAFLGMQSELGLEIGALRIRDPKMLSRLIEQKQKRGIMREFFKVMKKRVR